MSKISEFLSLGKIWCILTWGKRFAKSSLSSPSQTSLLLLVVFLEIVEFEEPRELADVPLMLELKSETIFNLD